MSNRSQDSVSQQLAKMQQEAATLEQTAQHRKNEVQAAQDKLNKLDAEFERKTAKLLAEQRETLDADARVLKETIKAGQRRLTTIKEEIEASLNQKLEIERQIPDASEQLYTATKAIESAQDEVVEARKQLEAAKSELNEVVTSKSQLEPDVSKLNTEKLELTDELEQLATKRDAILVAIADVDAEYSQKVATRESELKLAEAKLLDVRQSIELEATEFEKTRSSLAEWQKILADKDQNLRIREQKAEQSERKIIQNSNLMNL